MKINNKSFKNLDFQNIQTFEEISLLVESISKTYLKLAFRHYQLQRRIEDGIWTSVYQEISTISKEIGCNEKTVDRFNADMACIVSKRNRFKSGRQTSNEYSVNPIFYKFFKMFDRLGLFRTDIPFEATWAWIKKLWVKCGCDFTEFMNKVYNRKPGQSNDLNSLCEQSAQKMSLGESGKCPSIFYSLSSVLEECTRFVPASQLKKIEERLRKLLREAVNDMKWYVVDQKNHVENFSGLFTSRLKAHMRL